MKQILYDMGNFVLTFIIISFPGGIDTELVR